MEVPDCPILMNVGPRLSIRFLPKSPRNSDIATDGPFSGPSGARACGHWRLPCPTDDEAYLEIAHLSRSYPKHLRQSCPWEDSVAWAAPHRHRKARTWGLQRLGPFSPAFRWPEPCGHSRRGRCSREAGLYAIRRRECACVDANLSHRLSRGHNFLMPFLVRPGEMGINWCRS